MLTRKVQCSAENGSVVRCSTVKEGRKEGTAEIETATVGLKDSESCSRRLATSHNVGEGKLGKRRGRSYRIVSSLDIFLVGGGELRRRRRKGYP
jgi:hypothetical protein